MAMGQLTDRYQRIKEYQTSKKISLIKIKVENPSMNIHKSKEGVEAYLDNKPSTFIKKNCANQQK